MAALMPGAALLLFCFGLFPRAYSQQLPFSQRIVQTVMERWPDGNLPAGDGVWNEEAGTILQGLADAWYNTAKGAYYRYLQQSADRFITADGGLRDMASVDAFKPSSQMRPFLLARQYLLLYRVTHDKKYWQAASTLLQTAPTSKDLGASSLLLAPAVAERAFLTSRSQELTAVSRDFESQSQKDFLSKIWILSTTQKGPPSDNYAENLGWYVTALVDTLPYYAGQDPDRGDLLALFTRATAEVVSHQDSKTGLWPRNISVGQECLLIYALARGVRLGYLPASYIGNARRAWHAILLHSVRDQDGLVTLMAAGDKPVREGDQVRPDMPVRGLGPLLLASTEMELAPIATAGHGARVLVDGWFNSQQQNSISGKPEEFHYKWDEYSNPGFSIFGHIFRSYGVATGTLYASPTLDRLRTAQFYIIVSPDNPAKNPQPHYVQDRDADEVVAWVKQGGVLLLMENDPANADIEHLDRLADRFGIHFNNVLVHHVIGDQRGPGTIQVTAGGPLFHHPHTFYMKDTCSISVGGQATSLLRDRGDIVMATAKYGHGTVFAVVDPWLYNEYADGRNLPPVYDNFAGGMELVRWLLDQRPHARTSQ